MERGDFLLVGVDRVGPERVEVGIGRAVDIVAPGAEMDVARARQRHLGHAPLGRDRGEVAEILDICRAFPDQPVLDDRDVGIGGLARPVGIGPVGIVGARRPEAAEDGGAEAVGVGTPAEFPVAHRAQSQRGLRGDGRGDLGVLDGAQLVLADPSGLAILPRGKHRRGPDQAPDMLGAERRVDGKRHGGPPSSIRPDHARSRSE